VTVSPLRHRAAAVVALTALTAVTACGGSSTDDEGSEQTVTATMLPPIAQPDAGPADPEDARPVVTARFDADSAGREASLERRSGSSWEELRTAEVEADGTVDFVVEGGDATYRVVADASGDLPAATSDEVETGSWGELAFAETFDGDELSEAWVHRGGEYNPDGLRRCSKGSPEAVEVGGGVASLRVVDDPQRTDLCEAFSGDGKSLGKFHYRLNGHIASNALFTYGVTAARIKFQREKGQHGSFWLQSNLGIAPTDPLKNGAEIDVVEYFGDSRDDRLASFVYYPTEDGAVKEGDWIENARDFLAAKGDEWWKSFHVFAVEWTEDEYVIRIDGEEAWRTSDGISGQPEFIVLSLLSSDYELPNLPEGGLPQAMQVDWVQHWEPAAG
jgi:hypothetical protein